MAINQSSLSSFNVFFEVQKNICEILNGCDNLSAVGAVFFPENAKDIEFSIQKALKSQGIACICLTPSGEYLGHNGVSECWLLNDITLQCVEYVPVNRASNRAAYATGLDILNLASEILAGPNGAVPFGKLCPTTIEQGEENGLLVSKLNLKATVINGDASPIIYSSYVTRDEMEAYVGDGKLVLTKGDETVGIFSANSKEDLSVEIPDPDMSEYYTKSETDNLLDDKADNETVNQIADRLDGAETSIGEIQEKIVPVAPSTTAADDALAGAKDTADFVNSSINNFAAFYITKNAAGDPFETYAELSSATVFYNAGQARTPTKNDYCIVLQDETRTTALSVDPTTRYTYVGTAGTDGRFEFQYIVNNTALTDAQVKAINSGITKAKVDYMSNYLDKTSQVEQVVNGPVTVNGTVTSKYGTGYDAKEVSLVAQQQAIGVTIDETTYLQQLQPKFGTIALTSDLTPYAKTADLTGYVSKTGNSDISGSIACYGISITDGTYLYPRGILGPGTIGVQAGGITYTLTVPPKSGIIAVTTDLTAYELKTDLTVNYYNKTQIDSKLGDLSAIIKAL